MDEIWRQAPLGALRVTGSTGRWHAEPNATAAAWGKAAGWCDADWQTLAAAQMALPPGEHDGNLGATTVPALRCRHVPMADGRLLWLTPLDPGTPSASDRIGLLQAFGRIGWFVRDLDTGAARWDGHMFELAGIDPARGTPGWAQFLAECVHPDDFAAVDQRMQSLGSGPGRGEMHFHLCQPDGTPRLVHSLYDVRPSGPGRPAQMVGLMIDDSVAGRRLATAERSRQFLQQALERSGISVWRIDLAAGRLNYLTAGPPAAANPLLPQGIPLAEARSVVHPDDVAALIEAADAAQHGDGVVEAVARYRQPDGSWRTLLTRRIAERDDDGRPVALVGVSLDLSERQRQEEILREARHASRASREKSALLALMSHRLRTPLNAVLGFAALMARDRADPLSARQRERLSRIDSAGHELLALVDDVFELASLADETAPVPSSPVPLARVLVQVQEAVLPLARQRQVRVQAEAVDGTIGIHCDARVVVQALIHLVSHAVRRNEATGWVSLRVARDADPAWCLLHLRDGGPRLTAEQHARLFDPPSSPAPPPEPAPDSPPSGDALIGLGLVRHALERQGAQVRWGGVEQADTELTVRLPMVALAPAPGAPAASADAEASVLRLLCIEDNPVNTMLVQELVAMRPGIRLSCATDGLSGLALAANERPHVVLLDLQLPDITGQEVLARLRSDPQHAGCAVIALSANAVPEDIRAALAAGFDDYWTKPIDFDRFLGGLDRLMRRFVTGPGVP